MRAVLTPFNLKLQVFGSIIASQTINAYARDLFMYRSRNLGPENQAVETNLPPSPSPRGYPLTLTFTRIMQMKKCQLEFASYRECVIMPAVFPNRQENGSFIECIVFPM